MKISMRYVGLLVVVTMLTASLAACGENSSSQSQTESISQGSSNTSSSTELTGLAAQWPEFAKHHEAQFLLTEQGWTGPQAELDFVTPEIEERTNFKFKYEPLTCANDDAYKQKINLMAASGEVPEIFFGYPDAASQNIYKTLGQNNLIWDLTELLPEYETLYALVKPELTMYRTTDTQINYAIPSQTGKGYGNPTEGGVPSGVCFREDWRRELGMEYPKNPDELYTYLKRCKEELTAPDGKSVIPLTFDENLKRMEDKFIAPIFYPLNALDGNISYLDGFGLVTDYKENKVVNYSFANTPELMAAAKFMNKLYREGLLDHEVLTQKRTQYQEKISQARVAMHVASYWDTQSFTENAKQLNPNLMYVVPPVIYAEGVPKYKNSKFTNGVYGYSMVILSKTLDEETVRHFLAVLDYLATKEGQLLTAYGIEGKSYQYDTDGRIKMIDKFLTDTNNLDWNKQAAFGVQYWNQLVQNLGVLADVSPKDTSLDIEENRISVANRGMLSKDYDVNMEPYKSYYLNAGEVETKKMPALEQAKLEFWARVINASSESDVETIVQQWGQDCIKMGINDIIAERQEFLDTFNMD